MMITALSPSELPNCKVTANGAARQSQPLTMDNVEFILNHIGQSLRLNVMTSAVSWRQDGKDVPEELHGYLYENLSDILVNLDVNNLQRLDAILLELARQDEYHPMAEWLETQGAWDGVDRIDVLAATITTDLGELWHTFLENWLIQVVAGVMAYREGALSLPYCLVLVGGQGLGKTRWLENLGAGWMKSEAELHLSSPAGKDHQVEALKWPMVELSELDGIFRKSDVSHLKAFLSRPEDSIRLPYARRAERKRRATVFCGSVNDAEFLNDATGSRRFWPVQVDAIDWDFDMDWGQLWAQALEYWREEPGFDLTAGEEAQRARISLENHTVISPEAEFARAYLEAHSGVPRFKEMPMNRSDILRLLFGEHRRFGPRDVSVVGREVVDFLGKHRTIGTKQRAWMVPFNEFGSDPSTWPRGSQIKSV